MVTSGMGAGQAAGSHKLGCQTLESAVGGCAEWCNLSSLLKARGTPVAKHVMGGYKADEAAHSLFYILSYPLFAIVPTSLQNMSN